MRRVLGMLALVWVRDVAPGDAASKARAGRAPCSSSAHRSPAAGSRSRAWCWCWVPRPARPCSCCDHTRGVCVRRSLRHRAALNPCALYGHLLRTAQGPHQVRSPRLLSAPAAPAPQMPIPADLSTPELCLAWRRTYLVLLTSLRSRRATTRGSTRTAARRDRTPRPAGFTRCSRRAPGGQRPGPVPDRRPMTTADDRACRSAGPRPGQHGTRSSCQRGGTMPHPATSLPADVQLTPSRSRTRTPGRWASLPSTRSTSSCCCRRPLARRGGRPPRR